MSFPRYPAYKDSGVEWLGEVPEHWNLVQIKRILQSIEQGWSPQCEAAPAEPGEWGVLKVGCVNGGKFNPDENKALPRELLPDERLAIRNGDVLVSRANTRELVGSVAMAGRDYPSILLCDKLYRLRTNQATCCPAFLARYLVSDGARNVIETSASGASNSMLNIGQSVIVNMPIALPSAREQAAVIDFLDRETAKIDALIAEQQRLIGLLQEKRQAVISHAVTKGLNPDAPVKDSGVEWLGEVPEHWEVFPIWMLFFLGRGRVISNEDIAASPGDFPVYSSQTERDGEMGRIGTYDFEGDYLTWTTDGANAGSVYQRAGRFNCTNVCGTLRLKSANKMILAYALHSLRIATAAFVRMDINPKLMNNVMASIKIPAPPIDEQLRIASRIDERTDGFEPLTSSIARQLSLLKERRAALISAAVTGQIDVRGLAPEASAA
jgi:type I restriction enzyme S subunit